MTPHFAAGRILRPLLGGSAAAFVALAAEARPLPAQDAGGDPAPAARAAWPALDTLRLEQVVAEVRTANPRLRAARLRTDAAREAVGPAGAPFDPVLRLGLMNRPLSDFEPDEPMTMNVVQVEQRFPWPGTLGHAQEASEHLARAAAWDADEAEAELVSRAKAAYWDLSFLDRALAVMEETANLLREFLDVSSARYAVGEGIQQDVWQAQVAIGRLRADIAAARQERLTTAARLNALLGVRADRPVGPVEYREPGPELPPVDSLMAQAAEARPALLAARERVEAADAARRAAGRAAYPEFMVSLEYGHRPRFDDMGSVMLGVSLPVFSGRKQKAEERERAALQAMNDADAIDLHNETWAEIASLRARAERARELFELYSTSILPQAEASVESALSAYRVGRVDYMTLVESELAVNQYEIERARLAAEYHRARAGIEALTRRDHGDES